MLQETYILTGYLCCEPLNNKMNADIFKPKSYSYEKE